ncbi:33080_t:CDS:2, partial [Gigaspora margarita]
MVLSEHLLDIEVAKVINKVDKILKYTNNFTIGLDEFLYKLENYSEPSHIAEFLVSKIETVLNHIGINKISVFINDNRANIKSSNKTKYRLTGRISKSLLIQFIKSYRQLHHTQTIEIISDIMTNIAKTVFKKFEKEMTIENDTKLFNSAKDLYSNKPDLYLNISTFIDLCSSVFISKNYKNYKNKKLNEIEFDYYNSQEND